MTAQLRSDLIKIVGKFKGTAQKGYAHLLLILAGVGVLAFLLIAGFAPFKNIQLASLFPKQFSFAATIVNLLSNGDFETDFTNWPVNTSFWTIVPDAYQGVKSAQFKGNKDGVVTRNITVPTVGKTYVVSYWIKFNGQTCTSANPQLDCWGYINGRLSNFPNIIMLSNPPNISQANTPPGIWKKYSFQFKVNGPQTSGQLLIGPFSGPGWNWDFQVDDIKLFELPSTTIDPIVSISANKTNINNIADVISFTSQADDDDGSINYYFWDFGDGGKSNLPNPTYSYAANGTYVAKLIVYDDSGQMASVQTTITVSDPGLPTLSVSTPSTPTTQPLVTISGSAQGGSGQSITRVEYSTDRGIVGIATGTTNWQASLNLSSFSGDNKVLISAVDSAGKIVSKSVDVVYQPTQKIGIKNGVSGITQSASTVELFDKFEATFSLENSLFSQPFLPYETTTPLGMKGAVEGKGVTVEATFTSPSGKQLKQPGFLYQPYQRVMSTKQLILAGEPLWKIRFSPTEIGTWSYSVSVSDKSGTSTISDNSKMSFNTTNATNPNNHGFLQVSSKDKRYFEFSDGTPFVGIGPGPSINDSFSTDTEIAKFASGSANLSRSWMSGDNVSGSSWAPWAGGIDNVSNSPGTSLTTEQAYGDGVYSLTLPQKGPGARTAPAFKDCLMFGFFNGQPSIKTNTNYRVMVRLKTIGITGSGGFMMRADSPMWAGSNDSCSQYSGSSGLIPYQKGTTDWHTVATNWNSGNKLKFGYLLLTLENVTSGRVYIDEVSVREDLGNGQFGPEVLSRSKFNVQNYFSQEQSWNWDYGLSEFEKRGIYQKPVIEEKDDYSYNYLSPYGFGYDLGGQMAKSGASMKYQEYFWRYLTARWGYSRAVHSWEYANEQAPGSLSEAQKLAKYLKDNDPNKHMGNASNWAGLNGGWTDPAYPDISNADAHSYAHADGTGTSWFKGASFPLTVYGTVIPSYASMVVDSALYTIAHSGDQFLKNAAGNKPMIIGEAGLTSGAITLGINDTDTSGVWWHQFLWPQMGNGGAYFIYWYDNTIRSNNLSALTAIYRQFMEGRTNDPVNTWIPFTNGNYQDIQLTLPPGIVGTGQKDTSLGGAHFWLYDSGYTWITPTGGSNLSGKSVSFTMPAKNYTIEFWNTWSGNVIKQNLNHSGGIMNLTIPAIAQKDAAVKVYPTTGYVSVQITASPAPSSTTLKPGDVNGDGRADIFDHNTLLGNFGQQGPRTSGNLDGLGSIDIQDYNSMLSGFGR